MFVYAVHNLPLGNSLAILPYNDELRINFYLDSYTRSENELLSNRDILNYLRLFKIIVLLSNEIGVLQLMEEITENTKHGIRIDQIIR